jgi:hypothetical protein
MELTSVLSSAKTAFELARALGNGLSKGQIKLEEVPARLMELQQHILTMQSVVHDLAEENRQLREQLDDRERTRGIEADLEMEPDGQYSYRKSERVAGKLIQYCPVCWGENNKLIPLTHTAESTLFECGIHKTKYPTKAYSEALKHAQSARTNMRFTRG